MTKPIKKTVPRLETDRQAEAFLAQDLSNLDFSQFKPAQFKFEKKKLKQTNRRVRKSKSGRSERS